MIKHRFYIAACALLGLASCNSKQGSQQADTGKEDALNTSFQHYSDQFLKDLWKENPTWATEQGYHVYDSVLPIPGEASRAASLAFANAALDSLKAYNTNALTPSHLTDYRMMMNYLQSEQWELQSLKQYEWDPASYNVTGLIGFMLAANDQPLDVRLPNIYKRIQQIPAFYTAAKQQLKNPVDELKALGIEQNTGGLYVFETDFIDSVKASNMPEAQKAAMVAASQQAAAAVKDYVAYLTGLKGYTPRSFRLGKDLYDKKFEFDIQSNLTAEETYKAALQRKTYLHGEMAKISKGLWPKYFGNKPVPIDTLQLVGQMIDTLSAIHVKPEDFQSAIEKQIPVLVQFIKDKHLLYIDSSKPLVIRKEPGYMAGVAGASISAPGPYDKEGKTYYNVGSLQGWPAAKSESYLREYNQYILQILCIHEAIPGHYTQLVYANLAPSMIKSIFGNGAMVEGWAVYTEHMMLENGYGNNAPEMWLMWYKWHLRTVCNTILDYSVHAGNMSKEDAMHLLTKEAFQQQAEAEGKWKRVSVTSVQLTSYFAGYKAIYDLREKIKAKEGKSFDLRAFHEKFLSYGSAPVKYISELMLH
jgi:uncharacterized protein (DUF885 family)